jgi:hypothetical protein
VLVGGSGNVVESLVQTGPAFAQRLQSTPTFVKALAGAVHRDNLENLEVDSSGADTSKQHVLSRMLLT